MKNKIFDEKLDKMVEGITQTRISISRIEEHLRTMNGRLLNHDEEIETNKQFRLKATGAMAVLGAITAVLSIVAYVGGMV